MPYVSDENDRRAKLAKGELMPSSVGDLNFLVTLDMIADFKADIRYSTIPKIRIKYLGSSLVSPTYNPEWWQKVGTEFDGVDFQTAKELAFLEFYIRVGRLYEDVAIAKNGDLKEYEELFKLIEEKKNAK